MQDQNYVKELPFVTLTLVPPKEGEYKSHGDTTAALVNNADARIYEVGIKMKVDPRIANANFPIDFDRAETLMHDAIGELLQAWATTELKTNDVNYATRELMKTAERLATNGKMVPPTLIDPIDTPLGKFIFQEKPSRDNIKSLAELPNFCLNVMHSDTGALHRIYGRFVPEENVSRESFDADTVCGGATGELMNELAYRGLVPHFGMGNLYSYRLGSNSEPGPEINKEDQLKRWVAELMSRTGQQFTRFEDHVGINTSRGLIGYAPYTPRKYHLAIYFNSKYGYSIVAAHEDEEHKQKEEVWIFELKVLGQPTKFRMSAHGWHHQMQIDQPLDKIIDADLIVNDIIRVFENEAVPLGLDKIIDIGSLRVNDRFNSADDAA